MGSLVLLDPEGDALGQSLLALKDSLEVRGQTGVWVVPC